MSIMLHIGKEVPADDVMMACAAITLDHGHRIHQDAIECYGETLEDAQQLRDMVMLGMVRSTRLPPEQLAEIGERIQPANEFIKELSKIDRAATYATLVALRADARVLNKHMRASRLDDAMFVLEHLPKLLDAYRALANGLVQQEVEG